MKKSHGRQKLETREKEFAEIFVSCFWTLAQNREKISFLVQTFGFVKSDSPC